MNLKAKLMVALISLAPFMMVPARALSLEDFARLSTDDKAGYVALLVEASAQRLKTQGQPDLAGKVVALFNDPGRNGGVAQLAANLKMINAQNNRNATNPNNRAPVLQVEDAVSLTLKDNGILVPTSFLLTAGGDFHPSTPLHPPMFSQ